MKISIIVAAYNVENFIYPLLKSLMKIIHRDIEVILVNDGSNDQTGEILKGFAINNEKVKVINHEKNRGLSASRNTGLKNATGEWIHFIDADDYFDEKEYFKLMNQMSKEDEIIFFGYNSVSEEGEFLKTGIRAAYENTSLDKNKIFPMLASGMMNNYAWSFISRTNLWKKYGVHFPEGMYFEDIATLYKLLINVSNVRFLDIDLMRYVQRQNSITHTPEKNTSKIYRVFLSRLKKKSELIVQLGSCGNIVC